MGTTAPLLKRIKGRENEGPPGLVIMWTYYICIKSFLNSLNAGKFFMIFYVLIVVVFVALRPMSTAMVIAGRSVHITTLFPGQA